MDKKLFIATLVFFVAVFSAIGLTIYNGSISLTGQAISNFASFQERTSGFNDGFCTDLDNGINYFVKGSCSRPDSLNPTDDYCINSRTLMEYYCSVEDKCIGQMIWCNDLEDSDGTCSDGKCNLEQSTGIDPNRTNNTSILIPGFKQMDFNVIFRNDEIDPRYRYCTRMYDTHPYQTYSECENECDCVGACGNLGPECNLYYQVCERINGNIKCVCQCQWLPSFAYM